MMNSESLEPAGCWRTTLALALPMLLASLGTSIANIALPTLADAFAVTFSQVQWVAIAYLAAMTVSTVVVGWLADKYGHKRMLIISLSLFAVAALLSAVAPTLAALVAARAVQGAGAAFLMTLSMTLMRELASGKSIGRAMGILVTVSAVGTAMGPSLGGVLIPLVGWRGIFLIQLPLATLALVVAVAVLPRVGQSAVSSPARLGRILNKALARTLAINLLVAAVMMTTLVVGPFYLSLGLGLQAAAVGLVMSVGPLVAIFSGAPSGRLVDSWGTQRALMIGLVMVATGALSLASLPHFFGVGGYVLALIVLTPGYQLVQAANTTAALRDVVKDRRGTVSGLIVLSRNIGLIGGASAMGAVFAFGVGAEDVASANAAAIARGMQLTFLIAAGLIGASLWVARTRWPTVQAAGRAH